MLERELAILGLTAGAGDAEIRRAYHQLAKKYHPDLSGLPTDAAFRRVTHAYKNLTVHSPSMKIVDYPVREPARRKPPKTEVKRDPVMEMGNILLSQKPGEQRAFAARLLGNSGRKTAYSYLKKALQDTNPLVVRSSVEAIGKLGIRQSAGDLSNVFSSSNVEIRLAVLQAVERIGTDGGFRNIVLKAMNDSSARVRMKGLSLFAQAEESGRRNG